MLIVVDEYMGFELPHTVLCLGGSSVCVWVGGVGGGMIFELHNAVLWGEFGRRGGGGGGGVLIPE